jgi:lipoic acid synthetase
MNPIKPDWIKIKAADTVEKKNVEQVLRRFALTTVCEEALCPNLAECFGRKTATFMILGKICTRHCTFCNIEKGEPGPPDINEPLAIAHAAHELGLSYAVITSVTRDDLPDYGAGHFVSVINTLRDRNSRLVIEVLIPDFMGSNDSIRMVMEARPHIINHNIETVPGLYPEVRPEASYKRSIDLLKRIKESDKRILTKSGIMVGLDEREDEVIAVMEDLLEAGCEILTIGQYLAPSKKHHFVAEYVHPDVFERYRETGLSLGFRWIASAPFVRSSYKALEIYEILTGTVL